MFHEKKKYIFLIGLVLGVCTVGLWLNNWFTGEQDYKPYSDLKTLQQRGYIRVGILQNTTDYYLDNGRICGFQFELVELMSKHLDLTPHYVVYNTYWDNYYALLNNEVDVLAMNLTPTLLDKQFFSYTFPHSFSEHLLVQRKKDLYISDKWGLNIPKDTLMDKKIILGVPFFSAFYQDALKLLSCINNEMIELKTYALCNVNSLFAMLDSGSIDLLIADAQTVKSNTLLYPALDYNVRMTKALPQSWVVRIGNDSLCNAIDKWMSDFVQTKNYEQLVKKYFSSQSSNRQHLGRQQRMKLLGCISAYDKIIKKHADATHLDWRFVAAIIFQESKFNPTAEGKGGSFGLMQMMPATAQHYGTDLHSSAEKQIADGCKHICSLLKKYEKNYEKEEDLLKMVLLAYNTGSGYADIVRNMAQEKGLNPDKWQDIEQVLQQTSNKSFTQGRIKSKAKLGLKYVYEVWVCYTHYKNIVSEENFTLPILPTPLSPATHSAHFEKSK